MRLLLALTLLTSGSRTGDAQPRLRSHGASGAGGRSHQLLADGIAALAMRDFDLAARHLSSSYRTRPSAEALFYLGALALAQGHLLEAQDLMRRFVTDPRLAIAGDTAAARQAHNTLAQPLPPHGQLNIVGDDGTLVSIDGRLCGSLPLARPLLVAPGQHTVTLERGAQKQEEVMTIAAAHYLELRRSASSGAVVVMQLPSVLLVDSYDGVSPTEMTLFAPLLEQVLRDEQYSLSTPADILATASDPQLAGCLEKGVCQIQLAERGAADYVLDLRIHKLAADWLLRLQFLDVRIGDVAASVERPCPACTAQKAASQVSTAVVSLLQQAKSRAQGTLQVVSNPSGAEVRVGERLLGRTPLTHPLWAGPQDIAVSLSGYQPQTRRLGLSQDQTAELRVELVPDVAAVATPVLTGPAQAARPKAEPRIHPHRWALSRRWRLGVGVTALSAGALLLGFGASGLYMASQCVATVPAGSLCPESYHTTAPGATLTALGSTLVLGGAGLLFIPGSRPAIKEKTDAPKPASAVSADPGL